MSDNKTDQRFPALSSNRSLVARSSNLAKRGIALIEAMPLVSADQLAAVKTANIFNQGILLVDDQEIIRMLYPELLEEAGFTNIIVADRASKAIEILEELGDKILLVITHNRGLERDWEEGREMVKYLTNTYNGIVGVIFCSALASYADECMALGNKSVLVLDYIVKSDKISPLIESVRKNIPVVMEKRGRFINPAIK